MVSITEMDSLPIISTGKGRRFFLFEGGGGYYVILREKRGDLSSPTTYKGGIIQN